MKAHWGALAVLLLACGGLATEGDHRITPEGGQGAGAPPQMEAAAGGTSAATGGGSNGGALEGEAGADLSEAGNAALQPPLIGSATRYCPDDNYCFGFECYAPESLERRVCVQPCVHDSDCQFGEACLQSEHLKPGCYRQCESPRDCHYEFDCFDFANQQTMLVCFPTSWAAYWQLKHY